MNKQVNQQLIADKLSISRATVSRCFTNHPGINPETRGKVFRLAAAMGYQHMVPRTGKSDVGAPPRQFGILICTEVDDYLNTDFESPGEKLIAGASDYAQSQDAVLDIHFVQPDENALSSPSYAKINALQKRQWDGLLLVYPLPNQVVDELCLRVPVVSLVEQYSDVPVNCVDVDHHRGIAAVIKRLHDSGHRRIGFLTHDYGVEAHWAMRRHSAYIEEMTRLDLMIDPADVINVQPSRRCPAEQAYAMALERTRYGVSAWVCAADHQAYGLISHFKQRGVRVPEEVSVTGFDGIQKPSWAPQLSTVMIPYYEIGQIGARRLADLVLKRFGSVQHVMLDCTLCEGETIGPA